MRLYVLYLYTDADAGQKWRICIFTHVGMAEDSASFLNDWLIANKCHTRNAVGSGEDYSSGSLAVSSVERAEKSKALNAILRAQIPGLNPRDYSCYIFSGGISFGLEIIDGVLAAKTIETGK